MAKNLKKKRLTEAHFLDMSDWALQDVINDATFKPSQLAEFIANEYDNGAYSFYDENDTWNEFLDKLAKIYHSIVPKIKQLESNPKYRAKEVYGESVVSKSKKHLKETWEGEDVIDSLIERAKGWIDDGEDLDYAVDRALDDGLIYTSDIRKLANHYDAFPSDSELIQAFYEELYGDVYNGASDYYDEVHENDDEVEEDEDDFGESFKSYTVPKKPIVEKRGQKFVFDEEGLKKELEEVKEIFNEKGAEGLTEMSFGIMKNKFPNFAKWFGKYHEGMESNESGDLDENSTPANEYWEFMDDVDFKALFKFIAERGKQSAVKYYMQFADMYDSGLDETEVLADKVKSGEIKMVNGGR